MVPRKSGRWGPLFWATFLAIATLPAVATASPVCPPMGYSVTYTSPSWTVLVHYAPSAPLNATWYWSSWNNTFESFVGHTGRPPTSLERVTLDDADGDTALSASDRIQIWDDSRLLRNLTVAWYGNASHIGYPEDLQLSDGRTFGCSGVGPPFWAEPIVLLGVTVAVAAVIVVVLLSRRSRG